jgi:hypothetical protein
VFALIFYNQQSSILCPVLFALGQFIQAMAAPQFALAAQFIPYFLRILIRRSDCKDAGTPAGKWTVSLSRFLNAFIAPLSVSGGMLTPFSWGCWSVIIWLQI